MAPITPDLALSVRFLLDHAQGGLITVSAFLPQGGATITRTFRTDQPEDLRAFLEKHNGKRNLYFSVNPPRKMLKKKAKKEDIAALAYFHVDCDPRKGFDRAEERVRILKCLRSFSPRPTFVLDSGNGYQGFWRLAEPLPNDGDFERLEATNKRIETLLGGDNCHNLDRVMRVPGTVNLPTKKKAERGYEPVVARLIHESDATVVENDFSAYPTRLIEVLSTYKKLAARWVGDETGLEDTTGSAFDLSLVAMLKHRRFEREETRKILLLFPFGQYSREKDRRGFERCWETAGQGAPDHPDCEQAIDELNEEFAVALTGGRLAIIAEWNAEDGEKDFELLGLDAFKGWMQNRYCTGVNAKGLPITKELPKAWLSHPRRRQYREIGFWPGREVPDAYNMWRGFAIDEQEGDCSLFLAHLLDNVCQGDTEFYAYLIAWLAALFKHPGEKVGTAIVLVGDQGTGKTIIGEILSRLLGRHHRLVSSLRYVTGRFNAHLKDCLLLQCDEAFFAGDFQAAGVLKSLTTSLKLPIEFKGREVIWIDNHVRLLITSNAQWVVPAELEERRFATFQVGNARRQDHDYFGAIINQIENGGAEALLHFLRNYKYDPGILNRLPKTAALQEQKARNLPAEIRWLLDTLMRGALPGDDNGEGRSPGPLLYDHFVNATNKVGGRHKAWEMEISRLLREWIPGISRQEGSYQLPREYRRKRARIWIFPPLKKCRRAFEKKTGEKWDWEDQKDWLAEWTGEM